MDLVIATPKYDGREHADHSRSVYGLLRALHASGLKADYVDTKGDAVLPRTRNQLIAQARLMGAKRVLLVDSDIGFDVREALRMLQHDVPIVGGVAQAQFKTWRDQPRLVWSPGSREEIPIDAQGLACVPRLATAFLAVKIDVFEEMVRKGVAKNYVLKDVNPKTWPFLATYFDYALDAVDEKNDPAFVAQLREADIPPEHWRIFQGEDYWFCDRAVELGYQPRVDVNMRLRHYEGRTAYTYSLAEAIGGQREA